jgi:hypothetical protein
MRHEACFTKPVCHVGWGIKAACAQAFAERFRGEVRSRLPDPQTLLSLHAAIGSGAAAEEAALQVGSALCGRTLLRWPGQVGTSFWHAFMPFQTLAQNLRGRRPLAGHCTLDYRALK